MARPRRASRGGPRLFGSEFNPYYLIYHCFFFFALPYITKSTGSWRSGGADGSLICMLKRDPPYQRGSGATWSGGSGVPEEMPLRPRVESSPLSKGGPGVDIARAICSDTWSGRTLPYAQAEGGLQGQSRTPGRVRFGLASRADPAPHERKSRKIIKGPQLWI